MAYPTSAREANEKGAKPVTDIDVKKRIAREGAKHGEKGIIGPSPNRGKKIVCFPDPGTGQYTDCYEVPE